MNPSKPPTVASAAPLLAMPLTTDRTMMPITSSMIAAETIVVPSLVEILPSSFKTDTVIATEVAVRIAPTKMQR